MKRILSFIMLIAVFVTVFAMTNITASAGRIQILEPNNTTTSYWTYYEVASNNEYVVNIKFDYNSDKTGIVIKQCNNFGSMRHGGWCTVPRKIYGLPVTEIAANAFGDKSTSSTSLVKKLILPDTITKIGANAFDGYTALETIGYCGTEKEWNNISKDSSNTKLNSVEMKFGETDSYLSYLIENGEATVVDCHSTPSTLSIPQYVGNALVTKINPNAFFICDAINTVKIPASVTEICDYAFWDAQIESFEFSNVSKLTKIGSGAFRWNQVMTEIVIPDGVTSIGSSAFSDCKALAKATLPEELTTVEPSSFASCSALTSITIPEKVTSIGMQAFSACSALKEVTIPKSVTLIDIRAFYDYAGKKPLKDIYYGGTEDEWATITIESDGNEQLSNATIHYKEEEIEPPVIEEYEGTFGDNISWQLDSEGTLTVSGDGAISDAYYGNYPSWSNHKDKIKNLVIEDGITRIGNFTFAEYPNLTKVTLGNSLSEIGASAFYNCTGLKTIVIPDGVTEIESSAFYCTGLAEITIPKTVNTIGDYAIYGDGSLEVINFGGAENDWNLINMSESDREYIADNGVVIYFAEKGGSCGDNLIWRLDKNGTLTISGSGKMYGYFNTLDIPAPWQSYKNNITKLIIKDGATSIGIFAFCALQNLEEAILCDSINLIDMGAFSGCTSLKTIHLPSALNHVDMGAFNNCQNLTEVYYNGTRKSWSCIKIGDYNDDLVNHVIFDIESETSEFISILNGCIDYSGIQWAIWDYRDMIGLDLANYDALDETKQAEALELMVGNVYETVDDFTNALNTAIATVTQPEPLPETSLNIQIINGIYMITPENLQIGNIIAFVCYNDNEMVHINPYVYSGESIIPFFPSGTYNKIKIFAWEDLMNCRPLCNPIEF